MKILLLGDYSNVHCTLAEGLKALGHSCVVASDGDHWKDYPRDIDLQRSFGVGGNVSYLYRLLRALPKFRGYDVVQLINPVFLELKAERIYPFYRYLRRYNRKVVMGAFGMDYYWVKVNSELCPLRYSDFNMDGHVRHDEQAELFRREYLGTPKGKLCQMIAADCDGIVASPYENWATYDAVPSLRGKMRFIPFPVKMPEAASATASAADGACGQAPAAGRLRLFVGISRARSAYKGTDIMLAAARAVQDKYPERLEIRVVEGVPFDQYQRMMDSSDAILDQLYSYTPAMNALLAMSKGIVNIGGGEPESYEILGERELRPIVNVEPNFESCFREIERLVLHPELVARLKRESVEYVVRHHDYIRVAREYVDFYEAL